MEVSSGEVAPSGLSAGDSASGGIILGESSLIQPTTDMTLRFHASLIYKILNSTTSPLLEVDDVEEKGLRGSAKGGR